MSWWSGNDEDDEDDHEDYDESDVRIRPNPRGSRPRSKHRPAHQGALAGRVVAVDRGRYSAVVHEDTPEERTVLAAKARELGRHGVVTGDHVDLVGDVSGETGSLARIVRIHERRTLLRRSADDTEDVERIVVANADQLLIVVAAARPEPRANLVDRYLVAAFDAGITPILCVTKTDLADPAPFLDHFACLNLPVVVSRADAPPIGPLTDLLIGKATVAVGHSGVGKSTLVNALVPEAGRAIGGVNEVTGRGRHTSSSTVSLRFRDPAGGSGWIIDTPGIRSFGLAHVDPANVLRSFARMAVPSEPVDGSGVPLAEAHDWEIVDRVEAGELGQSGRERVASLVKLLGNLEP